MRRRESTVYFLALQFRVCQHSTEVKLMFLVIAHIFLLLCSFMFLLLFLCRFLLINTRFIMEEKNVDNYINYNLFHREKKNRETPLSVETGIGWYI